jgi:hypothetical protein
VKEEASAGPEWISQKRFTCFYRSLRSSGWIVSCLRLSRKSPSMVRRNFAAFAL